MEQICIIGRSETMGPYRISISRNPDKLLISSDLHCPFPTQLLLSYRRNGVSTRVLLKAIHETLSKHRMHGEWFDISYEELVDIVYNIDCQSIGNSYSQLKKWRNNNKSKYNNYMCEYMSNKRNKEKITIPHSLDYKKMLRNNPEEIYFESDYDRRSKVVRSTCNFVDKEQIRNIYRDCIKLAHRANIKLYVMHEIPLMHKEVCGLHLFENLTIATEYERKERDNIFDSEQESNRLYNLLKSQGL